MDVVVVRDGWVVGLDALRDDVPLVVVPWSPEPAELTRKIQWETLLLGEPEAAE